MLKKFAFMSVLIFIISTRLAAQFTEQILHPALSIVGYSAAAWGDYDSDGRLDAVIAGFLTSKIYHNMGNNEFKELLTVSLPGLSFAAVAWGDYDNDGDLDLIITGTAQSNLHDPSTAHNISKIYKNDGDGHFHEIPAHLMGVSRGSVAWADYDNDGDLDLLSTGDTTLTGASGIAKIYRNEGNDVFTEQTSIVLPGVTAGSTGAWADYDKDGHLDFILCGSAKSSLGINLPMSKIFHNDYPDNTFTEQPFVLTGIQSGKAVWGDYNNDGYPDLLLVGGVVKLYRNHGGNSFMEVSLPASLTPLSFDASVAWGDYDNDGNLDILIAGGVGVPGTPIAKIYRNEGGNIFAEQNITPALSGVDDGSVAWGDYDNDGKLDILLSGINSIYPTTYVTKIYRNTTLTSNMRPAKPDKFYVDVSGSKATFHWLASTDNSTPSDALTYNLYISDRLGKVNKMTPMADLRTGYRRVVAMGNMNFDRKWTISGFSGGFWGKTYYCGVQAIDNSFAGSLFATHHFFVPGFFQHIHGGVLMGGLAVAIVLYLFIRRKKKKTTTT